MPKLIAFLLHDFVAHPLIGICGLLGNHQAKFAWRLHDWAGEMATKDVTGTVATVAGEPRTVDAALEVLQANGFTIMDSHGHGPAGRGQAVIGLKS